MADEKQENTSRPSANYYKTIRSMEDWGAFLTSVASGYGFTVTQATELPEPDKLEATFFQGPPRPQEK